MAQTLAELLVKLGVDAGAFYRELDKSRRQTNTFKADLVSLGKTAAAAFAGYKIIEAVKNQVDALDELDEAAQKTGASVEALSALKYGADLEGVEDFTGSLVKLQKSMVAAQDTGSEQAKAFKALGVSVTDASGNLRSTDEALIEVADKLSGVQDGATKTAVAMAIFGKSGAQLLPWLNNGAAGLKRYADEAARFGVVATTEAAKGAAVMNDNFYRLGKVVDGLALSVGEALVPQITELQQKLLDPQTVQNARLLAQGLVTAFDWVTTAIGNTVGATVWAAESYAALIHGANDLVRIEGQLGDVDDRIAKLAKTAQEGAGPIDKLMLTLGEHGAVERNKSGLTYSIESEMEVLEKERAMLLDRKNVLLDIGSERPKPTTPPPASNDPLGALSFGGPDASKAKAEQQKLLDDLLDQQLSWATEVVSAYGQSLQGAQTYLDELRSQEQVAQDIYNDARKNILDTTRDGTIERQRLLLDAEAVLNQRMVELNEKGIADRERLQREATQAELENRQLADRELQNNPLAVLAGIDSYEELQRAMDPLKQGMLDFAAISNSALSSANAQFSDLAAKAILFGEDGSASAKELARTLAVDVVSGLVQVGVQMVAQQALASALQAAGVVKAAAANTAIAASAAPAAAATSLASFGSNSIGALAGMAAAAAAAIGLFSIAGRRELGGGVFAGSAYVTNEHDRPEFYKRRSDGAMFLMPGASGGDVVPANDASRWGHGGGAAPSVQIVNNGAPVQVVSQQWDGRQMQLVIEAAAQLGRAQAARDTQALLNSRYALQRKDSRGRG